MPYTKTTFVNGSAPAISAAELNKIGDGIAAATATAEAAAPAGHTHTPASIGAAAASHTHSASDVNAGTLAIARIPTGTTSSTVALGNHTHTPASIGAAPASHTHGAADLSGVVKTVNGEAPDGAGNVVVAGGGGGATLRYPAIMTPMLPSSENTVYLNPWGSIDGSAGVSAALSFHPLSIPTSLTVTAVALNVTTAGADLTVHVWADAGGKPGTRVLTATLSTAATGVVSVPVSATLPAGNYWVGITGSSAARVTGWQAPGTYQAGLARGTGTTAFYYAGNVSKTNSTPAAGELADMTTYAGGWTREDNAAGKIAPTVALKVTA